MTRYRLFCGAPSPQSLSSPPHQTSSWVTYTSHSRSPPVLSFPPSVLADAGRRLSMIYENVIFGDPVDDEDPHQYATVGEVEDAIQEGNSTVITWPATTQGAEGVSRRSVMDITFLRPSASVSRIRSQFLTQDTQDTDSYNYSNASSIANFPTFHFNLHALTSLAALIAEARGRHNLKGSRKVNLLAAVLEVEGPESVRIKKGPDAGKEVYLLKMIIGDETGGICRLSAWREVAEDWAGLRGDPSTRAIKKGDITFFENVLVTWEQGCKADSAPVVCSASPHLKSRIELCYRALPSEPQDARFRPDLRLGLSDAVVRKVASVTEWFERMAGLTRS